LGGSLVYIRKNHEPVYYQYSKIPKDMDGYADAQTIMETKYKHIHDSEWAWNNILFDSIISNNGTIGELSRQVKNRILYDL
jgi:hypothetical protein